MTRTLSKSKYMAGLQCRRRLWLACRAPELSADPDASTQAIFDLGHEIGRCAHALFPRGVLVSEEAWEHALAVEKTRALLADPSVPALFEAAFEHDGVRIRVDALERIPGGAFGLREVKASSRVKPEHLGDCAVQLYVLEGCGLSIASVELIHVNTEYVRGEAGIDWGAFFRRADLTSDVRAALPSVRERVAAFHSELRAPRAPEIEPAGHCFDPHECPFWNHCTREKPDDWVFHLPRIGSRFERLRAAGIERIVNIPDAEPLPDLYFRIREALRSGRAQIESGLAAALRSSGPPAHYLDFETANPAIPLYPDTRPYQILPFQWSLHSDGGDALLGHREFLADGAADPRREFAETLINALAGDEAPVLVYSSFEGTLLGQLAARFSDLAPALRGIRHRLFDLLPVVRNHLYHPDFAFSFSIKTVAPALAPGLDWDDLETIAEGGAAARALAALALGSLSTSERAELSDALRSYCARDTLALAQVHRAMRESAREP